MMIQNAADSRRFLFVGGLHRSGTTLLASMLAGHPDASGMTTGLSENEGQFLQTAYLRDAELGGAGRFAFDPRANRGACDDPVQAAQLRRDLLLAWDGHWDAGRMFMVEKTPGNCLQARFLQSVFGGDASFVFITRHPLANALATRKWSRTSLFALIEHWLHAHELMRAQLPQLQRVAWIAYENLVADPAGTLAELQAFLGMRAARSHRTPLQSENLRYFDSWERQYYGRIARLSDGVIGGEPVAGSAVRRTGWRLRAGLRRTLLRAGLDVLSTGREAGAIVAHYETRVRGLGYSLIDTTLQPAGLRLWAPGLLTSFAPVGAPMPVPDVRAEPRRVVDAKPAAAMGRLVHAD